MTPKDSTQSTGRTENSGDERPNIIFIITDQQRASTVSCYGRNEKSHTPAIDRLARRGIRFNSCYSSQPVCSPSRSSIITGLYPNATSVFDNCTPKTKYFLPSDLFSWLREIHDAGYRTSYIGKWHLGCDREPIPDYFDVWHGFETLWGHWIVNEPKFYKPGEVQPRNENQPKIGHIPEQEDARYRTDEETDFAIDFIKRNRKDRFACMLSFYPPHGPKTAPAEDIDFCEDRIEPKEQAIYHAMVHRIDYNVGRVLNAVDSYGLRDNTIIIFTSDHGENYPLKWNEHGKRLCYDQASNVPFIISWPAHLPQGEVIDRVISNVDFAPTLLDLCDLDWPDNLHGKSARGLMEGDPRDWHQDIMIQNNPYRSWDGEKKDMRERCVVADEWKLIVNNMRPPELFRREDEETPANNVYAEKENREVVEHLIHRLRYWGNKTGDDLTGRILQQWT